MRKYGLRLKTTLRRWIAEQVATEAADGPPLAPAPTPPAEVAELAQKNEKSLQVSIEGCPNHIIASSSKF